MNKMIRKILCIGLCLLVFSSVLPSWHPTSHAQSIYYYENFNGTNVGELPDGWQSNIDNVFVYQRENSLSKALKIRTKDKTAVVSKSLDTSIQGMFVFQMACVLAQYQSFSVGLRDTQDNVLDIIKFDSQGNILLNSRPTVSYEPNKTYDISVAVNTVDKTLQTFINGSKAGDMSFANQLFERTFTGFRFVAENGLAESEISILGVYIYNGNGLMKTSELLVSSQPSSTSVLHPLYETYTAQAHMALVDKLALVNEANHAVFNGYRIPISAENKFVTTFRSGEAYYVPLEFFANYLNQNVAWDSQKVKVSITYNDYVITIDLNTGTASVTGQNAGDTYSILTKEDIVYLPANQIARSIGKSVMTYDRLVLISDTPVELDPNNFSDEEVLKEIIRCVVYPRPQGTEILQDITGNMQGQHPRILFNRPQLEEIKRKIREDAQVAQMYEYVKNEAKIAYESEVGSLVQYNTYRFGIQNMAFVYLIENDESYAQRVYEEIKTRVDSPTWFKDYLNLAVVSLGTAIGYDWIYDYLTPQQRSEIEEAILTKSLQYSLDIVYRAPTTKGQSWWSVNAGNWNSVCNSGIGIAAIAIAEVYPDVTSEILGVTLRSLEYNLEEFQQGGGYWEGLDYWEFIANQLFPYLASLEVATGKDYGYICDVPGLKDTLEFPFYVTGSGGVFDYGDSNSGIRNNAAAYYVADKIGKPELAAYNLKLAKDKYKEFYKVEDIVWYNPNNLEHSYHFPYNRLYPQVDLATFRNTWRFNSGAFVGMLGSYTLDGHGHGHAGTFVYDAMGERWAKDLAKDFYQLPGYFREERSTYYRVRAEGHNTIVISPDTSLGQDGRRASKIVAFEQNDNGGYAIADLAPVYSKYANSMRRGVYFDAQTESLVVQDELELKSSQDIWWFMHTDAVVDIDESGKTAKLIKGSKTLTVSINSPADARFGVMQAKPLPTSPNPEGQNINEGTRKLYIRLSARQKETISVSLMPDIYSGQKDFSKVVPLSQWKLSSSQYARLKAITVGGSLIKNFDSQERYYEIPEQKDTSSLLQVQAVAEEGDTVSVDVKHLPGGSKLHKFTVSSSDPNLLPNTYYVMQYGIKVVDELPQGAQKHQVVNAENITELVSDASRTVDGRLNTTINYSTYAEFVYDLGALKEIQYVGASWGKGDIRQTRFDVFTSQDGKNWTQVFEGRSSGTTTDMEYYKVESSYARYVKLCTRQTEYQSWVTINDFAVYQVPVAEDEIKRYQAEVLLRSSYTQEKSFVAVWAVYQKAEDDSKILTSINLYPVTIQPNEDKRLICTYDIPSYLEEKDLVAKMFILDSLSGGLSPQVEVISNR